MRITKSLQVNQGQDLKPQMKTLDSDIQKLFQAMQGRISFGAGGDGVKGENIAGIQQEFTTSGTPDAENTVAHGLGAVPTGERYIVLSQDKAGSLYKSGTTWTATNAYFKCDVASVTFKVFILP